MSATSDPPVRISAAGLLLTYWCSARCAHCYVSSSPDRADWMSLAAARGHLAALARLGVAARGVHVGGGEPFGDYPLLLAVVRAARDAGPGGVGYVETNAFWATDASIARQRLRELREAGMRQISISADAFHQAFVDPACVSRLHEASGEVLGPGGVRARRWRFLQAPADLRRAGNAQREAAYRAALSAHAERMTGRAARRLAGLLPGRPAEDFRGESCADGLRRSGHVHVDPRGHVFPGTCAGLVLGRAMAEAPLDEVLASPRGPLWHLLAERGPLGLRELAAACGYADEPAGYADKCHLCTSVRTFLFRGGLHRDELGPDEVYEED